MSPGGDSFPASEVIDLVVTRLEADAEALHASVALLSDAELQRADRFCFDRDRSRFIVGRSLLRELLAARLGERPDSIEFTYGAKGKPALAERLAHSGLHFNVSHSNDIAVFAFAVGRQIGVDVEIVRAMRDADEVAARFFSRHENDSYSSLDPGDRPEGFFRCWTRKEAFIKALGAGLSYPLDRFDVSLMPGEPARILRVEGTPGEDCNWALHSFVPEPGCVGAVVVQRAGNEQTQLHVTYMAQTAGDLTVTSREQTSDAVRSEGISVL